MTESISEIRRRAWATRREKYGHLGHNGSYAREPGPCSACDRMRAVLVRLHVEFPCKVIWVRGHSGVEGNERADRLAAKGRARAIEYGTTSEEAAA